MARIRTIKPEFFDDYRMAKELPRDVRLFYIALWNQADDEGRFQAHPRRVLGACFPYDDDLSPSDVEQWMERLAQTNRLVLYVVDGEPYGYLSKFEKHQRINRPTPSRLPVPPEFSTNNSAEASVNAHGGLSEDSVPPVRAPERERDLEQGSGTGNVDLEGARARATPEPAEVIDADVIQEQPPHAKGIVPRNGHMPFAGQDWGGRVSGVVVYQEWAKLQEVPPSEDAKRRFKAVCQRLADSHTTEHLVLAFIGIGMIWPYAPPPKGKGERWTPADLEKRFEKALPAARDHPAFKRQRTQDRIAETARRKRGTR